MSAGKRPARLRLSAQQVLWAIRWDSESDDNKASTPVACRPLTTRTSARLVAGKITSRCFEQCVEGAISKSVCSKENETSFQRPCCCPRWIRHRYFRLWWWRIEEEIDSPIGSITVRNGANSPLPSTSAKKNADPKIRGILWQKKNFHKPDSTWLHDWSHAEAVTASDDSGPCALLAKYFSHDVFTLLAEETNLRYFTKERRQLKVTPSGMRKFMGICILMGNLNYPRLRMYWQTSYGVPGIADVMTQKRFLTIFANLAATSNQERPR